jgi:isopentenyl phosphate kinase
MTLKNGKIASADLKPLMKMLELGMVPVLYGDVVPDIARGVSILSGDSIVAYLARKLRAERVIVGVDVDGVYTANPKIRKDARLLRVITPTTWRKLSFTADEETKDVTGGMGYKIKELLELAKIGIESEIVNALKPGVVRRVLTGKKGLGTIVRGEQK